MESGARPVPTSSTLPPSREAEHVIQPQFGQTREHENETSILICDMNRVDVQCLRSSVSSGYPTILLEVTAVATRWVVRGSRSAEGLSLQVHRSQVLKTLTPTDLLCEQR